MQHRRRRHWETNLGDKLTAWCNRLLSFSGHSFRSVACTNPLSPTPPQSHIHYLPIHQYSPTRMKIPHFIPPPPTISKSLQSRWLPLHPVLHPQPINELERRTPKKQEPTFYSILPTPLPALLPSNTKPFTPLAAL